MNGGEEVELNPSFPALWRGVVKLYGRGPARVTQQDVDGSKPFPHTVDEVRRLVRHADIGRKALYLGRKGV